MGLEVNPNDKIPKVSYHKRGENEEMSKQEFAHRLSVFFEKDHSINLKYNVGGAETNSLFEKDVEFFVMNRIDGFFEAFDQDKSGGISFAELKVMLSGSGALADLAKGLIQHTPWNYVPNNPVNVLEDGRLSEEECRMSDE